MNILISNDDGVLAVGLGALRWAVADLGTTTVVAPQTPQSAAGHSITLREPLTVSRLELEDPAGGRFEAISVNGRPADCVRLALRKLVVEQGRRSDLVLAGINAGSNVGVNVFYSGTVAAAAEGAMLSLPAVAFSLEMSPAKPPDYTRAARFCRWVLDRLLERGLAGGDLINVNIPALLPHEQPAGVCVVPQSTAGIDDEYLLQPSSDGTQQYRLGDYFSYQASGEDTDVSRILKGWITITPLHFDMTHHQRLGSLAEMRWDGPPARP